MLRQLRYYRGPAWRSVPHSGPPCGADPRPAESTMGGTGLPSASRLAWVVTRRLGLSPGPETRNGFLRRTVRWEVRHYRLRVRRWDGIETEFEDPYRFPVQISDFDLHLFGEGTNYEAYNAPGGTSLHQRRRPRSSLSSGRPMPKRSRWSGDFNEWDTRRHPMRLRNAGVWEIFMPGLSEGAAYKYNVRSRFRAYQQLKADPYGFGMEIPPNRRPCSRPGCPSLGGHRMDGGARPASG